MLLDTTLYKSLSWSFMELIRSLELYSLGIRIQRQKLITFLGREQTIYGFKPFMHNVARFLKCV